MKMELINYNLISFKCVVFMFFAGLGCLLPFLPLHMLALGLTLDEARIISIVAPCVSLLGPLLVGPLADRLAGSGSSPTPDKSGSGRYLRIMLAVVCILGAVGYLLLLGVPNVVRLKARRPLVTFTSDPTGGVVLQERCMEEKSCHKWDGLKTGALLLSNCRYTCHTPPEARMRNGSLIDDLVTSLPEEDRSDAPDSDYDAYDEDDSGYGPLESNPDTDNGKKRKVNEPIIMEPPHLCYHNELGIVVCQVYTENSKNISINVNLLPATNQDDDDDEEWCRYPLGGYFSGRISPETEKHLIDPNNNSCRPVIQCDVDDPYDSPNSVLSDAQCIQLIGNPTATFWWYLVLRSIADMFPTAGVALLDAAAVIATRETSTGRGDVGRQLAWGSLGLAIFAPIAGGICQSVGTQPAYLVPIVMFVVCMVIAALILLFANQMPLSPPEWWWHTKCGMLALPMSAVRRYGTETGALVLVLLLLGVFWSALDSYLPWHVQELSGSPLLIGLTITMGALPAIPFLWHAEKIVDYCGHSNLLITAFTFYIIRYTGMSIVESPWWTLLCEAFEVFTLSLMWLTAILYLRHLIPRRFTVTGQALPVIAHFCLGRFIGAMIGGLVQSGTTVDSMRLVYRSMAIAAAVIAIIYFLAYHFYLKPKCAAPTIVPPRAAPTIMQSMNGNGSYTPLRVYHNGRARKGQFRY